MGLSSWQVLRAWTCHRQPQTFFFLFFLIELIEIYLPVPIIYFSNERNEAPSPKYCSCKIPLYQGFFEFSKISIFGLLTIASYGVFCQDFHCGNEEFVRRSKCRFMTEFHFLQKVDTSTSFS